MKSDLQSYRFPIVFLSMLIFALTSCVSQSDRNVERGSDFKFREGYPEVNISTIGLFDASSTPGINITAEIVYGSLIYKNIDSLLVSRIQLEVRIIDKETDTSLENRIFNFSIDSKKRNIVNSQKAFTFNKRIEVEPGDYIVKVTTLDKNSGKQITRVSEAYLPDPKSELPNLTSVQLLAKNNDSSDPVFQPVTTYNTTAREDSLLFRFQVTNTQNDTLEINSRLVKFQADTSIARRLSSPNYSTATIEYEGIEYDRSELIQENRRIIIQPGNVLIQFKFPILNSGNYRFEVNISNSSKDNEDSIKARDFGIKSENFPTLQTPWELARPLVYLMKDKEYEELIKIKDSDSLKKAIDNFWLSNIQSTQKASDVIALYYERVEMANKQFSNFKEGWKTDPGRIFILFGPPWYLDYDIDAMQWAYSYLRDDPETNFFFEKPRIKNKHYPFDHYIVFRRQLYFSVEFRQRQNWLSGRILTSPYNF